MSDCYPFPLKKGDTIALIAPCSGVDKKIYAQAVTYVESLGMKPLMPPYDTMVDCQLQITAQDAQKRRALFADAAHSDTKVLWCLSGGYGAYELLDYITAANRPDEPKCLIGYSDATVLMQAVIEKWGWKALHAPMAKNMVEGYHSEKSLALFEDILVGAGAAKPVNLTAIEATDALLKGRLMGGCASLLQVLIGTAHQPDYSEAIMLLEDDENETPQRLHRVLDHIIRAQLLKGAKAVILGTLYKGLNDPYQEIMQEALAPFKAYCKKNAIGLYHCDQIGHTKEAVSLLLGYEAVIEKNMLRININD